MSYYQTAPIQRRFRQDESGPGRIKAPAVRYGARMSENPDSSPEPLGPKSLSTLSTTAKSLADYLTATTGPTIGVNNIANAAIPLNWSGLTWREVEHVARLGIPVLDVCDQDIIREVQTATTRLDILTAPLEHRQRILDRIRTVICRIERSDLEDLIALTRAALNAFESGHTMPAQALAVAVSDTLLTRSQKNNRWAGKFQRLRFQESIIDVDIRDYVQFATWLPLGRFDLPYSFKEDRQPTWLDRHASIHDASLLHYAEWNGLIALMLAGSLLSAVNRDSSMLAFSTLEKAISRASAQT